MWQAVTAIGCDASFSGMTWMPEGRGRVWGSVRLTTFPSTP